MMKFKRMLPIISALLLTVSSIALFGCGTTPIEPKEPIERGAFYTAENWSYMTNGSANDSGGIPYDLDDGSIKFHNANQAYNYEEDLSNGNIEFMLNGSKNWQIWFLASSKDNTAGAYKLVHKDGVLYVTTAQDGSPMASANSEQAGYKANEWNKFKVEFSTADSVCTMKVAVNDKHIDFTANGTATVEGGDFVHTRPSSFTTGNYVCVKVWYGDCFLRLKAVKNAQTEEVTKIACIGDSITYGSNADNSYTDSYPAQLQGLFKGEYNVMNFGLSGTTIRGSADNPYRKCTEYNGVKLFKPDTAIVMLGSNDSKTYQVPTTSEIYSAFALLIDELRALNPYMEIYIATSPYAYSSAYEINNNNIENLIIPAQEMIADEYSLDLIPMHEYTKNMNGNYADGIHPTSKGYTYIAYRFHCFLTGTDADESYVVSFKD